MEGVFEGAIVLSPQVPQGAPLPINWLDIVEFAKAQPEEFVLSSASDRGRVCQFFLKGYRVEITEDDWKMIATGTLDRFGLLTPTPIDEDETAELATLDIVEQGLQTLIRKADEVAGKARQLNYHLSGRKAAIRARRPPTDGLREGFKALNQAHRTMGNHAAPFDLHADLIQQFTAATPQAGFGSSWSVSRQPISNSPMTPSSLLAQQRSHSSQPIAPGSRSVSMFMTERSGDRPLEDPSGVHRLLVQNRLDNMQRGDILIPPCDRCRRLKLQCIKHLTACQGCTKKHAKCSWKSVTDEEAAILRAEKVTPAPEPDEIIDVDAPVQMSTSPRQSMTLDGMLSGPTRSLSGHDPLPERVHLLAEPTRQVEDIQIDGLLTRDGNDQAPRRVDGEPRAPHSLLSHMASIATAQAEARESHTSRGSSTSHE
jgi:hypothetical protein